MTDQDSKVRSMTEYKQLNEQKKPEGNGNDGNGSVIRLRLDYIENDIKEIKEVQKEINKALIGLTGGIENLNGQMKHVPGFWRFLIAILLPVLLVIINGLIIQYGDKFF